MPTLEANTRREETMRRLSYRETSARGMTQTSWLKSHHSFSFGQYYDPEHLGFHALRVINDDWVAAGGGFPPHSHKDMEIITVMIEGSLEHQDSMGHHDVIAPGAVQRMSAGRGIKHSEFNHSKTESCRFLQIWLQPNVKGIAPEYDQRSLNLQRASTQIFASPDGRDGSMTIHQDAILSSINLGAGDTLTLPIGQNRALWLQLISGQILVQSSDGERLIARGGDGVAANETGDLTLTTDFGASLIAFDLNATL